MSKGDTKIRTNNTHKSKWDNTHTVHSTKVSSPLAVHRWMQCSKSYTECDNDKPASVVHDQCNHLASGLQEGICRFRHALSFYRHAYHFLRSGLIETTRVTLVVGESAHRLAWSQTRRRRPRRSRLARAARARASCRGCCRPA